MSDKVLVRIELPMADLAYDFRIPYDEETIQITGAIRTAITAEVGHSLPLLPNPQLWDAKTGKPLLLHRTFREQNIVGGQKLLLV